MSTQPNAVEIMDEEQTQKIVIDYLRGNPQFLAEHPDLFEAVVYLPDGQGEGVGIARRIELVGETPAAVAAGRRMQHGGLLPARLDRAGGLRLGKSKPAALIARPSRPAVRTAAIGEHDPSPIPGHRHP